MRLNSTLAKATIDSIGKKLGISIEEAALGIVRVANATMERALRKVSVERGHDPRHYTLIPFGGAGPLHACELAEALDIKHILVPQYPGVLSALGLLMADITYDASASILKDHSLMGPSLKDLSVKINVLRKQVTNALSNRGNLIPSIEARLDVRYRRQSYELEVNLPLPLQAKSLDKAIAEFHDLHQKRYGYNIKDGEVEIVTLRLMGRLPGAQPALPFDDVVAGDASQAIVGEIEVWFDEKRPLSTPCYDRSLLRAGDQLKSPCIVLQYDTTLVITGLWRGGVDGYNNINLWRKEYALLDDTRE